MTEQWFLDLDGVRSGPYQTPEVMSLISEGEILPHHRISTDLKNAAWMTILDWRLDQARITQKSPYSGTEVSAIKEEMEEPTPSPTSPNREAQEIIATELPKLMPQEAPLMAEPLPELKSTPIATLAERVEAEEAAPPPPEKEPEIKTPITSAKPKRDPAAEMFEMLQNTKKKKEEKIQRQAQEAASIAQSKMVDPKAMARHQLYKTIGIGLGIILVGFLLGQLFQQASTPKKEPTNTVTEPKPAPTVFVTDSSKEIKTEVIDRSTEKMTIRAVRPKEEVRHEPSPTPEPEKKVSEHELEELKDLKRELQELKALKEELKANPNNDEMDPNDPEAYIDNRTIDLPNSYQNYPNDGQQPPNR